MLLPGHSESLGLPRPLSRGVAPGIIVESGKQCPALHLLAGSGEALGDRA